MGIYGFLKKVKYNSTYNCSLIVLFEMILLAGL